MSFYLPLPGARMSITLKQLRVFLAVAHHQNLGLAADRLYLSKPAVSMALKTLEQQLGRDLFDRLPGRLQLNANGERLRPLADELLSRSEGLEQLFADAPLQGHLKIGASRTLGSYLLPQLLADFRRKTGHRRQQLMIDNSVHICEQLQQFELDIALIEARLEYPDLEQRLWGRDQMRVLVAPGHPLADESRLDPARLEGADWLLREPGSGSRQLFLQQLAPHIHSWHESLVLDDTEALINACAAGLGLTCLSQLAAHWAIESGRVVALDLALELSRPLYLVTPKQKYHSPLLEHFYRFCLEARPDMVSPP